MSALASAAVAQVSVAPRLLSLMKDFTARLGFEDARAADTLLARGALWGGAAAFVSAWGLRAVWGRDSAPLAASAALAVLTIALPKHPRVLLALQVFGTAILAAMLDATQQGLPWFFAASLGMAMALEPRTWWRRGVLLFAPAVGLAWMLFVNARLSHWYLPQPALLSLVAQCAIGLFVGAALLASTVVLVSDPVEFALAVEPKVQNTWLRLDRALARWPRSAARSSVLATARDVAARWAVAHRATLDVTSVEEDIIAESQRAVAALLARIEETRDGELREHLRQSLRVQKDTLEQFDVLVRQRERAQARAAAEASWLETACFTLEVTPGQASAMNDAAGRLRALASPSSLRVGGTEAEV